MDPAADELAVGVDPVAQVGDDDVGPAPHEIRSRPPSYSAAIRSLPPRATIRSEPSLPARKSARAVPTTSAAPRRPRRPAAPQQGRRSRAAPTGTVPRALRYIAPRDRPETSEPGHIRGRRDLADRRRRRARGSAAGRGDEAPRRCSSTASSPRSGRRARCRSSRPAVRPADARVVRPATRTSSSATASSSSSGSRARTSWRRRSSGSTPSSSFSAAADADEPLEHVLDLLSDMPGGQARDRRPRRDHAGGDRRARARRRRRRARPTAAR